jgi:hypothetical protein
MSPRQDPPALGTAPAADDVVGQALTLRSAELSESERGQALVLRAAIRPGILKIPVGDLQKGVVSLAPRRLDGFLPSFFP